MTAGSDDLNNGSDAYIEKIGIAGSHAYSLLEVIEIVKENGKYRIRKFEEKNNAYVEKLVKLRNPWGSGEWKGDWSDSSYKWNDELRNLLSYKDSDDGVFFMSYKDFLRYFSDIQICYYHEDYSYSALKI